MRNLILFIWKYHFTFIFILLEVIAVALLSTNNTYQKTRLHNFSLSISGSVYNWQEGLTKYVDLTYENEVLRQENALLENKLLERFLEEGMDETSGEFNSKAVVIINSTYNQANNYAIINAGRADGVTTDMGIRGPEGIIGVVTHVSENYAAVMTLIHGQTNVSCRLEKNNYFGLLQWEGRDHRVAILEDIPNHVDIDSGDVIVTRGASGIFPRDLLVGHALSTEKNPSTGFQTIQVSLATNFEKLNSAYLIQNALKPELDSLSEEIQESEQ